MNTKLDKYIGYKRMFALLASLCLWGVSMYFSYKGFEFESTEVLWFGIVLAIVVTVVELVFNTKINRLNPTLLASGILCYLYGTYTNISGFYILQRGSLDGFFSGSNWLIPMFAGLICEILPEALLAWAVGAAGDGDLIGNVGEMFNEDNQKPNRESGRPMKYGDLEYPFRDVREPRESYGRNKETLYGVNKPYTPISRGAFHGIGKKNGGGR